MAEPAFYRCGDYVCSGCKRRGLKLWRDYNTCASSCELKCVDCATPAQVEYEAKNYTDSNREFLGALDPDGLFMFRSGDQLGGLVPAIPTPEGDTFWGYSAHVPGRRSRAALPPPADPKGDRHVRVLAKRCAPAGRQGR